jgi:hypothetical protein
MARDGDRITAGDGEADLDFFGTTIKVRNPALAKLLSGGAVQDVVVADKRRREPVDEGVMRLDQPRAGNVPKGDVQVRIVQDLSGPDTGAGS